MRVHRGRIIVRGVRLQSIARVCVHSRWILVCARYLLLRSACCETFAFLLTSTVGPLSCDTTPVNLLPCRSNPLRRVAHALPSRDAPASSASQPTQLCPRTKPAAFAPRVHGLALPRVHLAGQCSAHHQWGQLSGAAFPESRERTAVRALVQHRR